MSIKKDVYQSHPEGIEISGQISNSRWSAMERIMGEQFKKNKYILALKKQLKPMINQPLFEKVQIILLFLKCFLKKLKATLLD